MPSHFPRSTLVLCPKTDAQMHHVAARKNATTIPNQQCSLMFAISTIHFDTSCSIH